MANWAVVRRKREGDQERVPGLRNILDTSKAMAVGGAKRVSVIQLTHMKLNIPVEVFITWDGARVLRFEVNLYHT